MVLFVRVQLVEAHVPRQAASGSWRRANRRLARKQAEGIKSSTARPARWLRRALPLRIAASDSPNACPFSLVTLLSPRSMRRRQQRIPRRHRALMPALLGDDAASCRRSSGPRCLDTFVRLQGGTPSGFAYPQHHRSPFRGRGRRQASVRLGELSSKAAGPLRANYRRSRYSTPLSKADVRLETYSAANLCSLEDFVWVQVASRSRQREASIP